MNKQIAYEWLTISCRFIPGIDSAIFVLPDKKKSKIAVMAKWPMDTVTDNILIKLAERTCNKPQPICIPFDQFQQNGIACDFFSYPIPSGSGLHGALVIKVKALPRTKHKAVIHSLKHSTRWLDLAHHYSGGNDDFYHEVVGLLASCIEQETYQLALLKMVSILCVQFECERVAFAEYHHHHCHVLALSNSAEFDRRSNLILLIGDAMDESIEQDSLIVFPQSTSKLIQRAHQELARKYGSSSLCTIPLIDNSHFFGAITLLSSEVNAMDKKSVMLCQQFLSLATPFLVQKREQEKSIFTKCAYALTENVKGLVGFTFLKFKLISGLVVLLLVFASLVEYEHQVSADAVLEGKIQRVIAAPISGYLLSASVRAGDSVKQGDEMATLNDSDLRLEQAKLEGHLQKLQRQYRKAQSNRDLVNVRVVKEQINQAKAELALNTELLAKTHLLAPFDGVVIEGNLEQMLGTPIERGDGLFKIAPLAGYRIILKVNESDIAHIQKGQQGGLLLSSLPNSHLQLTVENITAVSKADNGENIFRVEASLLNTPDILRPGMQGLGKINTGRASLLWIWTHKIKDAISLWLWSWLP